MSCRIPDPLVEERTFSAGESIDKYDKMCQFDSVISTYLPSLNFNNGSGATTSQYTFSGQSLVSSLINAGRASLRAPQMLIYSSSTAIALPSGTPGDSGYTPGTSICVRGSNLSFINTISLRDISSGFIINSSNGEVSIGQGVNVMLKEAQSDAAHWQSLNYSSTGDSDYDGTDLWASTGGGFNLNPSTNYAFTGVAGATFLGNSQFNAVANRAVKRMFSSWSFAASAGPGSSNALVANGPVDLCQLRDLSPIMAKLDKLGRGLDFTLTLTLNAISGSTSLVNPLCSDLNVPLYISLPAGLVLHYEVITPNLALEKRINDLYTKREWTYHHSGYLPQVFQDLPGFTNSTSGPNTLYIGQVARPAAIMLLAVPHGNLTANTSANPFQVRAVLDQVVFRGNNQPINQTPFRAVDQYEEICKWIGSDSSSPFHSMLSPLSWEAWQSHCRIVMIDCRPYVRGWGAMPVNLSVQFTRTDNAPDYSSDAVDYIAIVFYGAQTDEQIHSGVVSFKTVC